MKAACIALVLFAPATLLQGPNAAVTGTVLSVEGTASPGVRVMAVQVPEAGGGETAEVIAAFAETDASGAYRLENLSPGRYYIRAGLLDSATYYPGTMIPSQARIITVARGSALSGIDFALLRGAGVKLSGRVILDPRQQPSPNLLRVLLARGAPFVAEVPVNADGTFEFPRVAPGSYSVVLRGVFAVRGVQVGEKDVTGIEVRVPLRYEVAARMVLERNGPLPKGPVGVMFRRGDLQGSQAQFLSDAPIKMLFLEGIYQPIPNDIPQGYTVTSITRGSLDLMKEPLKIPSEDASEIVVTIRIQQ